MDSPDVTDAPAPGVETLLDEAQANFERGDYARAGELLGELDARELSVAQRTRYEVLERKLLPKPLGVKLALFGVLLFVGLTVLVLAV